MVAKDYLELIKVLQRYFKLANSKNWDLKTNFVHGRYELQKSGYRLGDDNFMVRSKHGIIVSVRPHHNDPEHWSKGGTFLAKTVLNRWKNHNTLVLNNSTECTSSYDFVVDLGFGFISQNHKELPQIELEDLESVIFQQSLVDDYSEEYGIACLHKSGLIDLDHLTFEIRLSSHLGSTEKTLLGIRDELKEYLKYVR